jgi:hypothetical protein
MSVDEFARTTPVRPPIVNRNTNPSAHRQAALYVIRVPYIVASHLKILIPVGTAIIIVADVKYARVSTSIPTVNMCIFEYLIFNRYYYMFRLSTSVIIRQGVDSQKEQKGEALQTVVAKLLHK